jgi:hypothetical protein
MHNAEAAIEPAFYDHEDEIVQRDRAAADWGADEVFATVPRRRFRGDHAGAAPAPRRGAHVAAVPPTEADQSEDAERAAWLAEVEAELTPPAPVSAAIEVAPAEETDLTAGVEFAEEPAGRRTVTITGRPEGASPQPRALSTDRRRPSRTVDERIGGRPDRVAGWAFGMGILLIVIAALS